ncbi:MAG TPA: VWA domain-containing protein, partial [Candidatus Competibacter sp.]|nr:VWA domain-containing protein [Candidatus Competibacter sp.]
PGSGSGSSSASTGNGANAAPPGSSSVTAGNGARADGDRRAALRALLAAASGSAPDLGEQARACLNQRAAETSERARVTMAENDPAPLLGFAGDSLRAAARRATAALRRRLGVLIQAQQHEAAWCARRGHRLAPARLYQTALPNPALFERRDRRDAPDTAVALLLDRSGSMHGRIALACQAVLATALALDTLPGVVSRVVAFPGSRDDRVIPLKDFAERAHRVAGRFGLGASGGTPLAPALWRVADDLLQRPETRRLAIVVTDGAPNNGHAVQDLIARCRAGGIEVIGLGITTEPDLIAGLFGLQEGRVIQHIEALAPALFRLLEQRLARAA